MERSEILERALALSRELRVILTETELELEQLPIFVRPLAHKGFRNKAGLRFPEWESLAGDLTSELSVARSAGAPTDELLTIVRRLLPLLERLQSYYRSMPGGAARFTRDQELLGKVDALSERRIQTVEALSGVLRALLS